MATGLSNRDGGPLLFIRQSTASQSTASQSTASQSTASQSTASQSTVETRVGHILGELGVSERVPAAVGAARNGLVEAG